MESVVLVAGAATVLSACQLAPQLVRSLRVQSTAGLSAVWAAIGAVLNIAWIAYRTAQELWLSLPSPIISAFLYVVLLALVVRTTPSLRGIVLSVLMVTASLVGAGALGGWALVGTALGLWGGIQIAPAVWSAFRTQGPLAIAPGLWVVGLGQAVLWGYFGYQVGDVAFIVYGITLGTGSALILFRCVMRQAEPATWSRRVATRVSRSAAAARALMLR